MAEDVVTAVVEEVVDVGVAVAADSDHTRTCRLVWCMPEETYPGPSES